MFSIRSVLILLLSVLSLSAQHPTLNYFPTAPGGVMQVAKWVVANSSSNLQITDPYGANTTVAKAVATTQSVTLFALPANSVINTCVVKSGTAFTGITTLTATVGITGSLTACISAPYDLKAAVTNTNLSAAIPATPVVSIASTDLILALTSTIENISSVSAGSITVWISWYQLP